MLVFRDSPQLHGATFALLNRAQTRPRLRTDEVSAERRGGCGNVWGGSRYFGPKRLPGLASTRLGKSGFRGTVALPSTVMSASPGRETNTKHRIQGSGSQPVAKVTEESRKQDGSANQIGSSARCSSHPRKSPQVSTGGQNNRGLVSTRRPLRLAALQHRVPPPPPP